MYAVAKPKEKLEVEILDVRDVTTYPTPGQAFVTHIVTYRHGDMPPHTIFIRAEEDTPENRAKIIREDIEKTRAFKPARMTV